jgi:hypothetical protein
MADENPGKQPSLADEEKAIGGGGGSGTMVAAILVFGIVAVGGAVFLFRGSGDSEYSTIGRAVNGIRQSNFDMFWSCVLPREDIRDLHGNADVQAAVLQRASASPTQYAHLVRTQCISHLDEQMPLLAELIPPPDLTEAMTQLRTAAQGLLDAWNAYLTYLEHLGGPYVADDEQAQTLLTAVVRGWYDYRVAVQAVNTVVGEHVHPDQ